MDFGSLWESLGPFNLIKLDVEGMELPILEDAREYLMKERVSAWVECNDDPASLRVAEFLLACGLNLYYFAFPSFNPDNFRGDSTPQFPFAYEAGLFATHGEPQIDRALLAVGCILTHVTNREALRRAMWQTPRWVPPQIVRNRAEETIALAVHALNGDRYETYLSADTTGEQNSDSEWAPVAELKEEINRLETHARDYQDQARSLEKRTRELEAQLKERDLRLHQLTELIRWTEALARDRLMLLQGEQKLRHQTEKKYQEIAFSSSWRATKPIRSILSRVPRLRGYLKLSARALIQGLRRR